MRTLVDLSDDDIGFLDKLSKKKNSSRAEMIRTAIALLKEKVTVGLDEEAFGLWRRKQKPALKTQKKLREEWL